MPWRISALFSFAQALSSIQEHRIALSFRSSAIRCAADLSATHTSYRRCATSRASDGENELWIHVPHSHSRRILRGGFAKTVLLGTRSEGLPATPTNWLIPLLGASGILRVSFPLTNGECRAELKNVHDKAERTEDGTHNQPSCQVLAGTRNSVVNKVHTKNEKDAGHRHFQILKKFFHTFLFVSRKVPRGRVLCKIASFSIRKIHRWYLVVFQNRRFLLFQIECGRRV